MGKHLRKQFSVKEVKEVFERYLSKEVGTEHVLALLKIKRRQFFKLLKSYREAPDNFSLDYRRRKPTRGINENAEKKIISELKKESTIIEDKRNPVRNYNYSYVQNLLETKHGVIVSLPTIITRAKKMGFIRKRNIGRPMIGRY